MIGKFFGDCNKQYAHTGLSRHRNRVWNMDETSIYLDCPSHYTYTHKGARRVKIETHGGEMTRMSAAFSAAADGTKGPILVIYLIYIFNSKPKL